MRYSVNMPAMTESTNHTSQVGERISSDGKQRNVNNSKPRSNISSRSYASLRSCATSGYRSQFSSSRSFSAELPDNKIGSVSRPAVPHLRSLRSSGYLRSSPVSNSPRIYLDQRHKSTVVIEVPCNLSSRKRGHLIRQHPGL